MPAPIALALLHPFPMDGGFWDGMLRELGGDRVVVRPEFPGLGAAPPEAAPSVVGFADRAAALIEGVAPGGRAVVCGLSMGGYVALSLAARHPERVAGLVLADTRAEPDTDAARAGRHAAAARIRAEGPKGFLDDFIPSLVAPGDAGAAVAARAIAGRQDAEAIARALEALAGRPDRRPDLASMRMPALVVVGSEDTLTPPACAEAMAAALPEAELHVMEGAGHLTALERPAEFAALVGRFLARTSAPARP